MRREFFHAIISFVKRKMRVGFDFDGVIAYNPLRFVRLPLALLGQLIGREDKVVTYCPKTKIEELFWIVLHETSFFPAAGFETLKEMLEKETIEGYLLTSRYACLEGSFYRWLKKHRIDKSFKGYFLNKQNEKPHLFKERIIRQLNLDYYIDDNFGIVEYLVEKVGNKKNGFKTQIHWVYNFLERSNPYQRKHPYLKKFLEQIIIR